MVNGKQEKFCVHRFICECYCCAIPDKMVIDHINDDRADNRLSNLHNNKQTARNHPEKRDYSFAANNHKNRRFVKAINHTTQEVVYFNSIRYMVNVINLSMYVRKIWLATIKNQLISAQES